MQKYLERSFKLDSTLAYNYLVQGRVHLLNNNIENAYASFKRAVQLNPNGAWMNQGLGGFLLERGLLFEAAHYFEKAIALDPLEPLFYVYLAQSHHWAGEFKKAELYYQKALELESQLYFARVNYLHLMIELNRLTEAEKVYSDLLQHGSDSDFLQAKLLAARREKEKALQFMGSHTNLQIYGLLGMQDESNAFLEGTIEQDRLQNRSYYWLYKTNPCYGKVRSDTVFQNYLVEHKKIYEENLSRYSDL
jgi:tetratricopeptide (TPR) repeat protein